MVATLYASIRKFLVRTLQWYKESSFKRAIHTLTKPGGLQYYDILEDMPRITINIMAEATAGSQAEQRDMHHELIAIRNTVETGSTQTGRSREDQLRMLLDLLDLVRGLTIDVHSGHVT